MIQKVTLERKKKDGVEKYTVILDTDKVYSGEKDPTEEEKEIRRAVGLPVTKQLIYYPNPRDPASVKNVVTYQLMDMYEITERWYTIKITTEDGKEVMILSWFLNDMQKPSFIEDYKNTKAE